MVIVERSCGCGSSCGCHFGCGGCECPKCPCPGATGATGATGSSGEQGATGVPGATGATGAGSPGGQGATGATGAQGATGAPGTGGGGLIKFTGKTRPNGTVYLVDDGVGDSAVSNDYPMAPPGRTFVGLAFTVGTDIPGGGSAVIVEVLKDGFLTPLAVTFIGPVNAPATLTVAANVPYATGQRFDIKVTDNDTSQIPVAKIVAATIATT